MQPFEHYLEAESLVDQVDYNTQSKEFNKILLGKAQVHATLALVVEGKPEYKPEE